MKFAHSLIKLGSVQYILIPVVLFLALGLYILPDFDVFYDEVYETTMARDNVALFLSYFQPDPIENPYQRILSNLEYYGTFFNLVAYAFQTYFAPDAPLLGLERLEIKRYVIFFFSLLGYGALALSIYKVTRLRYSLWLAFGILALMPLYFHYTFSNPKDIPFAVLMTIVSTAGAYGICSTVNLGPEPLTKRQMSWLFATGLAIGLCASVRIVGIVTFGFWGLAWIICALLNRTFKWESLLTVSVIVGVTAFVIIWISHPVAYSQPLMWIIEALQFHANHPHHSWTLTNGEWLYSRTTPRYFLPLWLFVKIPLLWQFLCFAGVIFAACDFRGRPIQVQALYILFFLQLLFLPAYAVINQTHLYNEGRHFLFIYPAVAFFCCVTIWKVCSFPRHYAVLALSLIAFMAAKIGVEMSGIHPYHAAYFIEPVRNDVQDKWMFAGDIKENITWINKNTDGATVIINTRLARIGRYASIYNTRPVWIHNARRPYRIKRPYYVIDNYPLSSNDWRANCEVLHRVTRPLGAVQLTLGMVKYCP